MNAQLLRVGGRWNEVVPQVPDRPHGFERARHHLGGARAAGCVGHLRLEQLGVGEDDAQLVVQAVEEEAEFWRIHHVTSLAHVDAADRHGRVAVQAWFRCSCCQTDSVAGWSA